MTTETNDTAAAPPARVSLMDRLGSVAVGNRGIQLANIEDIFRFAKAVALSQLCPPGFTETDCFVIIANGLEVGMSPMAALASTYVVNNRATIFGDMPLALCRQSGLVEDYDQEYLGKEFEDDFRCVVTTKRKGAAKPIATSYSVADAKVAEVWGKTVFKNGKEFKTPWVTNPKRMLLFRARGFNLRDNFGDVLKGCAIAELGDDENIAGFEHAKAAAGRVVEPNFDGAAARSQAPPAAALPTPGPTFGEETVQFGAERATVERDAPRRRGRPRKEEAAAAPTAAPEAPVAPPETKPEAPPQPPPKPPLAPPATQDLAPKPGPFWEVNKRLAEEGISHKRFLLVMKNFAFLDDVTDEEISAGDVALSELDDRAFRAALSDWKSVVENLPPV